MNPAVIGASIPIIAILAGIAVAIVAMLTGHRRRLHRADLRHRERLAAIDKGFELPPDPPDAEQRRSDPGRFLRHGLVLVALGVTVTGAMMQLPDRDVPYLFGLVPAAIGVAYLLYYFIHERAAAREPPGPGGPNAP
jgi:lysozyme family protein